MERTVLMRLGKSPWCMMCMTGLEHDDNHPKEFTGWTYEMARRWAVHYTTWGARLNDPRRVRIFSIRMAGQGWRYWAEVVRDRPPGDMHEPPSYPAASLEWSDGGSPL